MKSIGAEKNQRSAFDLNERNRLEAERKKLESENNREAENKRTLEDEITNDIGNEIRRAAGIRKNYMIRENELLCQIERIEDSISSLKQEFVPSIRLMNKTSYSRRLILTNIEFRHPSLTRAVFFYMGR